MFGVFAGIKSRKGLFLALVALLVLEATLAPRNTFATPGPIVIAPDSTTAIGCGVFDYGLPSVIDPEQRYLPNSYPYPQPFIPYSDSHAAITFVCRIDEVRNNNIEDVRFRVSGLFLMSDSRNKRRRMFWDMVTKTTRDYLNARYRRKLQPEQITKLYEDLLPILWYKQAAYKYKAVLDANGDELEERGDPLR